MYENRHKCGVKAYHNRIAIINSRMPTKAKSWEPAYSQVRNQNKIDRQGGQEPESRADSQSGWWMVFGVVYPWCIGMTSSATYVLFAYSPFKCLFVLCLIVFSTLLFVQFKHTACCPRALHLVMQTYT